MTSRPDEATLCAAVSLACRAPSVHNSQPWRWRVTGRTVDLYADRSRQLRSTDSDGRDLVLSCGAALHHLQVALAASGWLPRVRRLPDPRDPDHLATVEASDQVQDDRYVELAAAIPRRRAERRALSSWEVPAQHLESLAAAAQECGALLAAATDTEVRGRLVEAFVKAAARQNADPDYQAELSYWSGRGGFADDGVPAANTLEIGQPADRTVRAFSAGEAVDGELDTDPESAGELLVLASTSDDLRSRLLAGEALSAVLLTATSTGLASCPLTQPLEVARTRRVICEDLLGGTWTPQVLLRVGWLPMSLGPLPETPRRRLEDVLSRP
jgi:nitroreductase